MMPYTETKIVLVVRRTRLAELRVRFATKAQAEFYVRNLGVDFSDYEKEDKEYEAAVNSARAQLGEWGRLHVLGREFLPNYIFGPEDIVVALGQDGLVANTLKYLDGQPLIGVNSDPERWDGELLPYCVFHLDRIIPDVLEKRHKIREVTMAEVSLNTGLRLRAVNDLFIGMRSHVSARYKITSAQAVENHSSSGVIVSTGMGSTGWFKSLMAGAIGITKTIAPTAGTILNQQQSQFPWESEFLQFTVREPYPSRTTGADLVFGKITKEQPLILESQMPENGVIFSDGIENDFLEFNSGTKATINIASKKGVLVV